MDSSIYLPIESVLPALSAALSKSRSVILSAPPGAGKTTRVPIALLEADWLAGKKILMLEPRRLAARRAASYMSQQLGERVGQTVGYRIRGDAVVGKSTRIEVVTEGILTRMLHANPDLPGVGLVIFDEFHERSIHADLGLAFTLDVQKHLREDLRVLVMSATLDGVAIAQILQGAPIIESQGTLFSVETRYSRSTSDKPLEARIADVVTRALNTEEGDILVFLPGMREIRRAEEKLQNQSLEDVVVHMLHGDLPAAVQEAALSPAPKEKRKVILSTSIAETSLTIDGVRIVVDSGLARSARFDPRRGMSGLVTIPVSHAVADQRRGRAGRQGSGVCYRLWTESEHAQLPAYPVPEIRTSDLAHLALDLALWGAPTGEGLSFLDPPPAVNLIQAQLVLRNLGAMKEDSKLTPHGRAIASLPIHPRLAHMIVLGKEMGFGATACRLAALLEEGDIGGGKGDRDIDLASHYELLHRKRGFASGMHERILAQTRRLTELMKIEESEGENVPLGVLLALAYPERIARRRPDRAGLYQLSGGTTAALPSGSTLTRNEYLAIADVEAWAGNAKIHLAAPLAKKDLEKVFGDRITGQTKVEWSDSEKKVVSRRVRMLGAVIIDETPFEAEGGEVTRALIDGLRRNGLASLPWNKETESFRARVQWARRLVPLLQDLPDLSDDALASTLEKWLAPFLGGMWKLEHLQRLQLGEILRSQFSHHQLKELDRLAPSHLQVPSGSRIALNYTPNDNPALSVKLQELFGLTETPRVGGGAIPVTIHLLSPAARPLAVTQDLRSFWQNVYPDIRKQLRARYPKHPWPENPLAAVPTKKTIRRR